MCATKTILILDDSPTIRSELLRLLQHWGFEPLAASCVEEAVELLAGRIDFAIVDVYLDGARGDELSAQFIQDYLEPRSIPFGRYTSAPESVPDHQQGCWVLHKYDVRNNPQLLHTALLEVFDK